MTEPAPGKLQQLAADLRQGESLLSLIDLLAARFSHREHDVCAFVPESGRFDRLRNEARELLERFPEEDSRPALFGVPVGIKDVFHVHGFLTRGGSRLPPEELHGLEAESVTTLREAGALILGKTVSTEFAYFAPGPTRNPRNPEHTPGGSSSGSAAAVGAGLCPLALGTQTIGSVCRPAAFCGVVGYKPSYDRISRSGMLPLAPSLDHTGTFTADAASAGLVASQLCRGWKEVETDRQPVLGVPEGPYLERASDEGLAHFNAALGRLADTGYTIESVPVFDDFARVEARHGLIVAAEAARVHGNWFPRFEELYHEKTAELVRRGQQISSEDLSEALTGCGVLRQQLTRLMEKHGIDLWVSPAAPGAAPIGLESTGDPVMNLPWSQAGLPSVSVPSGRNSSGMPIGLQLIGRWWRDEALLAWARDIEAAI